MELLPSEIINEILLLIDKRSLYYAAQVCIQWWQLSLKQVVIIKSMDGFDRACFQGDHLSIVKSEKSETCLNAGLDNACEGVIKT